MRDFVPVTRGLALPSSTNVILWSIHSVLAVEPYIAVDAEPGHEVSWTYRYIYGPLAAALHESIRMPLTGQPSFPRGLKPSLFTYISRRNVTTHRRDFPEGT